jgi:hypothetical protein
LQNEKSSNSFLKGFLFWISRFKILWDWHYSTVDLFNPKE